MHDLRYETSPLVSSSVTGEQLLCCVHGQGQKSEQKQTKKDFVEPLNLLWPDQVNIYIYLIGVPN